MKILEEKTKTIHSRHARAYIRDGALVNISIRGMKDTEFYFDSLKDFGVFLQEANELHKLLKQEGL